MKQKNNNSNVFSKISYTPLPKWNDLPELDLYIDQVISLMEKYLTDKNSTDSKIITKSMINNYVKIGAMPAPIKKKYSKEHLAYLIIICSLKQVVPISTIKEMIDNKLESCSISEVLDFYSDLYEATCAIILDTCSNYIDESKYDISSLENASLFTAIASNNCINISNKLLTLKQKEH